MRALQSATMARQCRFEPLLAVLSQTRQRAALVPPHQAGIESNDLNLATAQIFLDLLKTSRVTTTLYGMTWEVIALHRPKTTFLTSDRPIIKTGRLYGLTEPHLVVPISPLHLFVASNSERVFEILKGKVRDSLVADCNNEVVRSATKYVWGTDNSQLRFVENRLTKSPQAPFSF
jgi:hypothetical protein